MNDDALKVIWSDNAQTDSSFSATYEEFKSAMNQSQDFRNAVYEGIRERDNEATATNQEWDKYLGFNSITNTNAVEETEKPAVTTTKSTLRNEAYSTLSDKDLQGKYNEMLEKAEHKKKEAIEKAKEEQDKFTKEHPFLYAASQVGGAPMNINQPSINPIEALEKSEVSFYLDENDKNEFNSLRKEIGVRNYESGFETIKKSTEDEENRVKNIRANAEANGVRLSARDRSMLRKAEEINRDARELVEAGSKYGNEKGIENWADGLSNTLLDRDMIAGVGLIRDMNVDNLVEKLNNNEKLSESENALLLAAYNFEEVAKARSFDLSAGYKIGQGTAESIPFVVDMLITRGMTNVGKAALLKLLANKGKDVAKLARIMDVSLDGGKVVRSSTGEKLLHGAYELGETALQTAMMPSSQRQMVQERTEIKKATESNDISFLDNARIFGNAYVQTFTERAGGKAIDWALGKMIPSGNILARFGYKEGVLKSLNDIIQSPLSEVGEEYLGSAINLLRSIDLFNIYSQESNEDMRNEAMSLFSAEGFGEVVGTTLPMSLFGDAANGIAIATKTNQFNKAHLAFGKMLEEAGATNTQAENILAQIERASSQEEFNERLSAAKGFLKKHIQETETDLGIANTKMQNIEKIIDNYNNSATTFNNAIKDLRKLYAEMPQEKKDAMKADFENMRRKLNESITMTQQPEGPADTHNKPESGWQKRTMSVKIDGKNTKVTFSGDVVFSEDGSINTSLSNMDNFRLQNDKGQNVRTTVKGEEAKQKKFDTYLDAVNNALREEKTEKDKKIAEQKAAEEAIKAERKRLQEEEKKKMEEENARIEAQKQAIAQQKADRQNIIASFPKDKNGEVDIDKMSPEQFFVYESDTDSPEAAMNTVGDVLNDLYQQLAENANETNREKRARNAAKMRNRIRQYEAVVVKYAGQETLDKINAARAEALQLNTPPVQEGAPVVAPVVEQDETPAEPAAPEEETPQGELPAEPDTTPLPSAEPVETRTKIIDVKQDMADGKIKAYYSVNGGGQWYVVKDGAIVARSEKANKGDMPNNATEVTASLVYKDENGIKKPVILITTIGDYHNLRKKDAVIIDEYGLTTADTQSLYDSEVKIDESTGEEIDDFIQINQNTSESKKEREEIKKYTTLDSLLGFPLLRFRGNEVFTMKDLLELGYRTGSRKTVAKQKDGSRKPINKSVLYSPYDLVKGMLKEKYPNDTDVEIQERMNHFANQFQRAAVRWNELVASKHSGIEGLSIDNVNIQTSSTGDHQTAIAQFMMAASEAVANGIITTEVSEKVDTLPKKFNPEQKDRIISNRTNEEILDDVQQLEQEIKNLEKLSEFEDTKKDIAAAKRKLNNLIKALSGSQAQFLSEQYRYGYVAESLKKRMASKEQQEVDAPAGEEGDTTKETPAKPKANIDKLRDAFVEAYARTQNQSYNALQKTTAKNAFKGMIDKMSEEDAIALYLNLAMESAKSQGKMQEDIANAAQALLDSKHGAAINAITGGAQQETNQPPIESTEETTGETEQTAEDAIDYEALVAERNELQETIYDMEDDEAAIANARIAQINEMLRNRAEFMVGDVVAEHAESTKRIIKILKAAGIRVITFKNEDLPKYVSKKKLEELSDGQIVYGFASNDTIYLNEDHFNPNSPLHEFTHLWVTAYKQAFPNEWKRFVEIANKSALAANLRKPLKDGNASPYAKLSADEMASEVLSRYTGYLYGELDAEGRTAFENMMQAQTMEEKIAEKSLLKRIRDFWKKIISWFDKSIENEKKEDVIDDMIRQFAQAPMETLAQGREAVDELKQLAKQGYKVQSVYHGTTAEFGQFDHDFMGSGEGAQAYGWGTYVSQVEDIAISYAKADARRKTDEKTPINPFDKVSELHYYMLFDRYVKSGSIRAGMNLQDYIKECKYKVKWALEDILNLYPHIALSTPTAYMSVESMRNAEYAIRSELENNNMPVGDAIAIEQMLDNLSELVDDIESYVFMHKYAFEEERFNNAIEEAKSKTTRHLYEVQIPADAYLEDGSIDLENSPYLGWDDDYAYNSRIHRVLVQELSEEVDKLAKELSETPNPEFPGLTLKEYVANGDWFYEEDMSYFSQELKDKLNNYFTSARMLRILSNHSEESGAGIYRIVDEMTGSPKAASEWLLSNGIVGVRVSTDATSGKKRDTKNYVIFNEADAHIVNHTAFMIGEDGKLMLNNTSENLDNSKKSSTFAQNNGNYGRNDERTMDGEVLSGSRRGESRTDSSNGEGRRLPVRDVPRANGGYDANVAQSVAEQSQLLSEMLTERGIKHTSQQVKLATPQEFYDAIVEAKQLNPHGWMVDAYGVEDYAGFTCLLTEDGKSGIAIKPNGDIISVFSSVKRDNRLQMLMPMAIMQGGRKLDCYYLQGENGNIYGLPKLYSTFGFKIAATTNFVEEYVPQEEYARWREDNNGSSIQGVAAMYISDEVANDLINNYNLSATPNTNAQNFPSADTGYGEALAERDKLMILENARANGTIGTINGKKSNLPDELWAVVRTDAFKDWFGDWQNDPANASKVLDKNGEPLVVYHGSKMAGFDEFQQLDESVNGFFTTDNKAGANTYATNRDERRNNVMADEAQLNAEPHHGIYSLFANIKNPAVYDFAGKMYNEYGEPLGYYVEMSGEEWDNQPVPKFATEEEALAFARENGEPDSAVKTTYLSTDDLVEMAKAAGHDGVIFKNVLDGAEHNEEQPVMNDYIAFKPNQLKSATQNIGTFSSEDNRIEFMIGPAIDAKQKAGIEKASNKLVKGIAANVPLPERMNELGKIWTEASDGGEVFRQLLKALREFNAKHGLGRKLPDGSDIRQVYTNSRSVLVNKLRELTNLYEKPLRKNLEELIEIVKVSSMYDKYKKEMRTVEEEVIKDGKAVSVLKQIEHELTPREFIERYLIACDNIERYQNGIPTRGLAMFKQWMGVDVIEFQAEFEAAFGASKEGEALLKNLWKSINDYTNYTLEDSFACEMITPEEYYRRKGRKFYIPERDFAIDKDLEQPEVAPKKRYKSNKLSSSIKAKGGKSLAANIIENIFYIGNTDLQKNNKNRVKLAMWNLLQANPEFRASIGLPRPEEVWYDRDGKRVSNAPTREERKHMRLLQDEIFRLEYLLDEELSKEEALQDKKEIDSLNEELKKAYKEREDIPYMLEYEARHRFQSEGDPNLVGVYVNGTMCSMSFPNMSLAAIALNDAWDKSPNIWNPIRWIKGHISSVITAIEPAFFLKNVPTDGMSIILNGAVQYGWEFSLRYIATAKDILKHGKLVGTYVSGGDYRSLENGELFRDFLMNGGNTGYSSARSMDKILKELESLDRGHSSIKEAMEQSKKSLTFMNECTELLLRFAAYKTAIDMGKGVEEATNAANNLSANFNRRGERVPLSENVGLHTKVIYGFIRMFKELSMFYNPAMQGAMQFFRMFGESGALDTKEKVERWTSVVVNAMFIPALAGFLNAMMFRDDDEEEWSVTEYDRANYLVIGKNGRFAMGHMTRPFYNIGVNIALHMQGRRDGGQIADSILTSFLTHLTPCAPSLSNIGVKTIHGAFGGQELNLWDYLQSFTTPEALAVFNEAADGVNFMGQQIKYDDEKIAMHTKNPNAGVIEKVLAKMWFCVGGGEWDGVTTLKRKGEGDVHDMFNVTPNEVRTFISLLMPKTFIDTGNVIAGAIQNKVDKERDEYVENNIKLKHIPFFNTFISERTPEAYRNGIYSEANKIARANKLIMDKAYKEMVRISVKMNNELPDEEYIDLEKRYEHFEAIYKQAAGDVIAGTLREILPAYKEVRFSNIQKKFSMSEKELRKYLSDIDYDSLEESERELIFNMSQLVQMQKGCGSINSKIPQWMKGIFGIEPTSAEVQELWDMYEENIEK